MQIRVLPDSLVNQIAAGEVVERPASVVKELVENALDAGADEIVVDVLDGGRTEIRVVDNGGGMSRENLARCITRHATSKLPDDDLLNISYMGFRGEALPSIASVSDMTIDTCDGSEANGWEMDCTTGQIKPSDWDSGTRVRVRNLFGRTPARLKFLRSDRAEMMSVLEVIKRLAMARGDVGFTLNNKWRFPKNQHTTERLATVMGDDVTGKMLCVDAQSITNSEMRLCGYVSEPTLRRATSVDQYLFVNGRPVKDKVLVGALRAAYMDVMHAREFPLCALYLTVPARSVDVNVSPAKTEVHFLEPDHVRSFIIKSLRDVLSQTLNTLSSSNNIVSTHGGWNGVLTPNATGIGNWTHKNYVSPSLSGGQDRLRVCDSAFSLNAFRPVSETLQDAPVEDDFSGLPLGRVIGQIGKKYILAETSDSLVVVDQHAAHERITYEHMRQHVIKRQPLLTPIVVKLRAEDAVAVMTVADDMRNGGLVVDSFGDDAIAIFEKPADWDLNWAELLHNIADEVRGNGHSSNLGERLHLKLANYACHHSVRAGQKLDYAQMDALLRDIENTERGGECNHGRPVYKFIPFSEIDSWFERI